MISCAHPRIIINQAVYEAVAFSKFVVLNGIIEPIFGVSKLNISPLYRILKDIKKTVGQEVLDLYYTEDRFHHKVPLFIAVPCNKCELCQLRDSNILSQRCQFEAEMHDQMPWFITLTFSPAFHPKDNKCRKHHIQMYLKRLRSYIDRYYPGTSIKFYAQGEYGELHGRMHYHLLIYGLPLISFNSAVFLFKSAWRSKKQISIIKNGKIFKFRPLIGRVGVSQINSKEYRAYYLKTRGRELKPEDGIKYCCSYSTKDSLVRTWSLGLGKSFVEKYLKPDVRKEHPCYDLKWTNRYNKQQPVILSRWFLGICFKTFNRSTYYLRSKLTDCLGSSLFLPNWRWFFEHWKPAFKILGITTPYRQSFINCYEYILFHRSRFNPCKAFKSRFMYRKIEYYFESLCNLDFDFYRKETELYYSYLNTYFSLKPELTQNQISIKYHEAKKFYRKRREQLISL